VERLVGRQQTATALVSEMLGYMRIVKETDNLELDLIISFAEISA
jgi:hypothetical protein